MEDMVDTPRLLRSRAPRPPHQLVSKPIPPFPPPPPRTTISATTSPSHDDFSFPSTVSSFSGRDDLSMSRAPVVGRVGSDLSHLNHSARASSHHHDHHHATTSSKDRDSRDTRPAKNKALPPFFSGLGGPWRKDSSSREDDVKQGEEKRKADRAAKRTLEVGRQWVKRHMATMVEQLRASFSGLHSSEKERREQRRRRPHSFSGHGPGPGGAAAACRETRERERWRRRRRDQLSSAPASLRVSPANSGHLSVGGSVTKVSTSSEESTMEELQSAIEAAIAHCKNSISVAKQTQTTTQTTAPAGGDDDSNKIQ